jgi:hypothetical protein
VKILPALPHGGKAQVREVRTGQPTFLVQRIHALAFKEYAGILKLYDKRAFIGAFQ